MRIQNTRMSWFDDSAGHRTSGSDILEQQLAKSTLELYYFGQIFWSKPTLIFYIYSLLLYQKYHTEIMEKKQNALANNKIYDLLSQQKIKTISLPKSNIIEETSPLLTKQMTMKTRRLPYYSKRQRLKIEDCPTISPRNKRITNDDQKSTNKKLYLFTPTINKNKSRQLLDKQYTTVGASGANTEFLRKIKRNETYQNAEFFHHNQFNLTTLSKRQEMNRAIRLKDLRRKQKQYFSMYKSHIDQWNSSQHMHGQSSRSFYPLQCPEFKTMKRTVISSQGAFYSKFYQNKQKQGSFQLEITKANFSQRESKADKTLKILAKNPKQPRKTNRLIPKIPSRQLIGWEINEEDPEP